MGGWGVRERERERERERVLCGQDYTKLLIRNLSTSPYKLKHSQTNTQINTYTKIQINTHKNTNKYTHKDRFEHIHPFTAISQIYILTTHYTFQHTYIIT